MKDADHCIRASATHSQSAQAVKKNTHLHILHVIKIIRNRFIKSKELMA